MREGVCVLAAGCMIKISEYSEKSLKIRMVNWRLQPVLSSLDVEVSKTLSIRV